MADFMVRDRIVPLMTSRESTLSTVKRGFEVLQTVYDTGGITATDLTSEVEMPQSTLYKYITTLESEGYLVKDGDEYHVSLKFLGMGIQARDRYDGYKYGADKVKDIAKETGERAQFVAEENGRGIYLQTEAPESTAVKTNRQVGTTRYLHSSASGKAILANLPMDRVDDIITKHGLPAETKKTITDREELYDELEQIRETGVAYNDEESINGLRAVGVPVKDAEKDLLLGSLSVSGPSNRLEGHKYREEIPELLLGYANEIELNVRYN